MSAALIQLVPVNESDLPKMVVEANKRRIVSGITGPIDPSPAGRGWLRSSRVRVCCPLACAPKNFLNSAPFSIFIRPVFLPFCNRDREAQGLHQSRTRASQGRMIAATGATTNPL